MACSQATYTIQTGSHTAWNGTLAIDASGNATFTPTGGSAGNVQAQCGSDSQGAWILFTNTNVTPAVHYLKAHYSAAAGKYSGDCNNNSPKRDVDTWTAEVQPVAP